MKYRTEVCIRCGEAFLIGALAGNWPISIQMMQEYCPECRKVLGLGSNIHLKKRLEA